MLLPRSCFSLLMIFLKNKRAKHFNKHFFEETPPPFPHSWVTVNIACIFLAPIIIHACTVSQAHVMSDILPGCFGLGGCQPQFCTSLQAQFDVVWITFRHTHTPSLAFIQGSNAGHPLCSEGGIWQGPNTPGKKSPSFPSPIAFTTFYFSTVNTKTGSVSSKASLYSGWLLYMERTHLFVLYSGEQQLHLNTVKLHLNTIKSLMRCSGGKSPPPKAAIRLLIKLKKKKKKKKRKHKRTIHSVTLRRLACSSFSL